MRTSLFVASLVLFLISPLVTNAQTWSVEDLQREYTRFLEAQSGVSGVTVDSDGDVQFAYNERTYFIEVNEDDNEFFRVVLPNIWPIESIVEAQEVMKACNSVNRTMKCTKAYATESDNVWIAVELFLEEPNEYRDNFMRMLKVIDEGVELFVSEM